ncbi:MAG: DUF805 domain-containing protein [Oscillospiraceae bacterium]|jgi:uncharacterized membrane protein YhaH (DUF805 family)|nr:DUF805 domain-containing protein [Oscillospiraceae bacterium]MBR5362582.1 DUF805 domain-containing protein [Oscillospiraceae bacterium]
MLNTPLVQNYIKMIRNYATFTGRASRSEYWLAVAMNCLIVLALNLVRGVIIAIIGFTGSRTGIAVINMLLSAIQSLYSLFIIVPMYALQVRRLHDVNRSGWWLLFSGTGFGSILLLIWYCTVGTEDTNLFGSDPHPIRQY